MNLRKTPRTLVLTAGYVGLVHVAAGLSLLLRYDGRVPREALLVWASVAPAFTVLSLAGFWVAGLYHGLWRYAGTATVFQIVRGVTLSAVAWAAMVALTARDTFPPGIAILVWTWELLIMGGVRLAWRLWRERVVGGGGGGGGGAAGGGAARPPGGRARGRGGGGGAGGAGAGGGGVRCPRWSAAPPTRG